MCGNPKHTRGTSPQRIISQRRAYCATGHLCGPVHHPGKINCLQLDKTIGSHRCWQAAMCTWRDFLSAGACSPVGKDGSVSRGNREGKSEFSVPNHNNHKAVREGKQALLNWATLGTQNGIEAMPVTTILSLGPKAQDYISLRYRHHLEHVKWKPTGEILAEANTCHSVWGLKPYQNKWIHRNSWVIGIKNCTLSFFVCLFVLVEI